MEFSVNKNVARYTFTVGDTAHVVFAAVIPERLPPSFNDMINHSVEWRKNQSRWFQHFMSKYCRAVPTVYLEKRTVRIDLFKKSMQDDAPNLDGRSKCILDPMKQLGMICDDNHKFLDWARVWQRKGKENATVILVSETMSSDLMMQSHDLAPHALGEVWNLDNVTA